MAAEHGQYQTCQLLIERGARVAPPQVLNMVAARGYQDIAQLLIASGAQYNSADLIHQALRHGQLSLVKSLLNMGDSGWIDPNILFEAAEKNSEELLFSMLT